MKLSAIVIPRSWVHVHVYIPPTFLRIKVLANIYRGVVLNKKCVDAIRSAWVNAGLSQGHTRTENVHNESFHTKEVVDVVHLRPPPTTPLMLNIYIINNITVGLYCIHKSSYRISCARNQLYPCI